MPCSLAFLHEIHEGGEIVGANSALIAGFPRPNSPSMTCSALQAEGLIHVAKSGAKRGKIILRSVAKLHRWVQWWSDGAKLHVNASPLSRLAGRSTYVHSRRGQAAPMSPSQPSSLRRGVWPGASPRDRLQPKFGALAGVGPGSSCSPQLQKSTAPGPGGAQIQRR